MKKQKSLAAQNYSSLNKTVSLDFSYIKILYSLGLGCTKIE